MDFVLTWTSLPVRGDRPSKIQWLVTVVDMLYTAQLNPFSRILTRLWKSNYIIFISRASLQLPSPSRMVGLLKSRNKASMCAEVTFLPLSDVSQILMAARDGVELSKTKLLVKDRTNTLQDSSAGQIRFSSLKWRFYPFLKIWSAYCTNEKNYQI